MIWRCVEVGRVDLSGGMPAFEPEKYLGKSWMEEKQKLSEWKFSIWEFPQ